MLSVRTKVNSRLSEKLVKNEDAPYYGEKLHMTAVRNSTPTEFPTLNVDCLGEPSTNDGLSVGTQSYILSSIELKSYTDTKLADARKLADKSGDVMLSMGYSLIYGPEVISDIKPFCVVTRFRRLVGAGDTI